MEEAGHLQRKGDGEKGPGLPPEVLLGLFQQCVKVKRIKFVLQEQGQSLPGWSLQR